MNAFAPAPVPTPHAAPLENRNAEWTFLLDHLASALAREYVRLMEQAAVDDRSGEAGLATG